MNKIGIILQARTGSTRLPGKILKPFYNDKSILDLIVTLFKNNKFDWPVILATSVNEKDIQLREFARKHGILFYRGSEENVLDRFIKAAEEYGLTSIVRVCADNPFLSIEGFNALGDQWLENELLDYLSFKNDANRPAIKTHWGLFTEFVSLKALKKVAYSTKDSLYLEHVTNFIYENPGNFKIKLINAPTQVLSRDDVRFTIDTIEDFKVLEKLYSDYLKSYSIFALENLIEFVDQQPHVLNKMKNNINANTK